MQQKLSTLLLAFLLVASLGIESSASANHPTNFPHKHEVGAPGPRVVPARAPRRVLPRRTAPRRTAPRRQIYRAVSDTYIGVNGGASFLAGGTFSKLSTIAPTGAMLEAISGWRMNPWVALEISGLLGFHADEDPITRDMALLIGACMNTKMYLNPTWRRIEPYVLLGVGIYGAAREQSDTGAVGIGFQGGLGLDLHLNPFVSLSADATYRGALWEDDALNSFFQSFVTITTGIKLLM